MWDDSDVQPQSYKLDSCSLERLKWSRFVDAMLGEEERLKLKQKLGIHSVSLAITSGMNKETAYLFVISRLLICFFFFISLGVL